MIKHGFYSNNVLANPEKRMLGAVALSSADMVFAEGFLLGDDCNDPVRAHQVVKAIFESGERKYPTLWSRADKYVHWYEYATMEKLSNLPGVELGERKAIAFSPDKVIALDGLFKKEVVMSNGVNEQVGSLSVETNEHVISYAYASSEDATRHGFGKQGCYTLVAPGYENAFLELEQATQGALALGTSPGRWSVDHPEQIRRENLGALGFKSEADYESHQVTLNAAKAFAEEAITFSLPAKNVIDGQFSGMVVDVSGGFVTQRINREGDAVKHDASKLSAEVNIRDIVDINYAGGVGVVSGLNKGKSGIGG